MQLLIAFTGLAVYSIYERHLLSLPTPLLAHVLGLVIPPLSAVVAYSAGQGTLRRILPLATPSPLAILAMLDTILLTLTAADLRPTLRTCLLESKWRKLFEAKDSNTIRRIQDVLDCCGFRSVRDQAWPLPHGSNGADACVLRTARTSPCRPGLMQREQSAISMLLAIAVVGLLGKVKSFHVASLHL